MRCPICGKAELIHDTRDLPYVFKGEEAILPGIEGDFCPACGEIILDATNSMRAGVLMGEFNQQVNAASVDPQFIVNVRKKLELDQKEAAAIFGGGVNAFSRYEDGKARPPLSLVKLLKVLERHPDLLSEVR